MIEQHYGLAIYLGGLFSFPAGMALIAAVYAFKEWIQSPRRTRIMKWRTWRIRRLQRKAELLRGKWHAEDPEVDR